MAVEVEVVWRRTVSNPETDEATLYQGSLTLSVSPDFHGGFQWSVCGKDINYAYNYSPTRAGAKRAAKAAARRILFQSLSEIEGLDETEA